ncbi:guanyl-specific ribonuclease C2 [Lentinula aciculospora]|uniref:Guanyl-specific ribonuclease C2 n=1 Tax=Lentinula aciculospora TaxID=153920 RepID=A0A9W9AP13_9AGAR|nr:guanyl-specific ribonuclease C2 [Lentinula aciculospora]
MLLIRTLLFTSSLIVANVLASPVDFKVTRSLPEGDVTCGSTVYTLSDVESAVSGGFNHLDDPIGDDSYPHIYHDYEDLDMYCSGSTWYEYPILKGGAAYSGGEPGADRVVFNPSGTYCAVITHTGASDDDFLACEGD